MKYQNPRTKEIFERPDNGGGYSDPKTNERLVKMEPEKQDAPPAEKPADPPKQPDNQEKKPETPAENTWAAEEAPEIPAT